MDLLLAPTASTMSAEDLEQVRNFSCGDMALVRHATKRKAEYALRLPIGDNTIVTSAKTIQWRLTKLLIARGALGCAGDMAVIEFAAFHAIHARRMLHRELGEDGVRRFAEHLLALAPTNSVQQWHSPIRADDLVYAPSILCMAKQAGKTVRVVAQEGRLQLEHEPTLLPRDASPQVGYTAVWRWAAGMV